MLPGVAGLKLSEDLVAMKLSRGKRSFAFSPEEVDLKEEADKNIQNHTLLYSKRRRSMTNANADIIYKAIKQRRSVRSYTDQPLPNTLLERLIEVGQWAPSPSNVQSWRFVVVIEQGQLSLLKNLSPGFPRQATAAIVICSNDHDTQRFSGITREYLVAEEATMAAQNMLLMVHAMGYGSCVIAGFSQAGVAALLELPERIHPVLIVALGIPDHQPAPPPCRPLAKIAHWETYRGA